MRSPRLATPERPSGPVRLLPGDVGHLKALDDLAAHDRLIENGIDVGECDVRVPIVAGPERDNHSSATVFEATGAYDHDVVAKLAYTNTVLERAIQGQGFALTSATRLARTFGAFVGADENLNAWAWHE